MQVLLVGLQQPPLVVQQIMQVRLGGKLLLLRGSLHILGPATAGMRWRKGGGLTVCCRPIAVAIVVDDGVDHGV